MVFGGTKRANTGGQSSDLHGRPNSETFCLTLRKCSVDLFSHIDPDRSKHDLLYFYCLADRVIFSLRDGGLMEGACLSQETLHEGAAAAQARSTLAVIDNSSFYQAIILHVSAIESLLTHLAEYQLGIL
jgi:hypothetical protein